MGRLGHGGGWAVAVWMAGAPAVALSAAPVVTTQGHRIILELEPGDWRPGNLLDLQGKTIRFTPDAGGYRAEALPLQWEFFFGNEFTGTPSAHVEIVSFAFPFSGRQWSDLYVGTHGNVTFGADQSAFYDPGRDRFLRFRDFAGSMTGTVPLLAPLFRKFGVFDPFGVNHRYVRELPDRLVITWVAAEPYRDVFSFTNEPRFNYFQTVLYATGAIDFNYDYLTVEDGIVGVFPVDPTGGKASWTLTDATDPELPDYLDVTSLTASLIDEQTLRFGFHLRGPPLPPGDPRVEEVLYRVFVDTVAPFTPVLDFDAASADFGLSGAAPGPDYATWSPFVDVNSLGLLGDALYFNVSTAALGGADEFSYFTDAVDGDAPGPNFDQAGAARVALPEVIAVNADGAEPALPPHLDVRSVTVTRVGNHGLRFSFHLSGDALPPGDPGLAQLYYRVFVDLDEPFVNGIDFADADAEWGVSGGADLQYRAYGPGVSPAVNIDGPTLSLVVPLSGLQGRERFAFFYDAVDFSTGAFDQVNARTAQVPAVAAPGVDLSGMTGSEPPRPLMYEAFYHPDVPDERILSAAVIAALGDRFDFLAFYTDFRIDRQESGAVSSGPIGDQVGGVVPVHGQPSDFGSAGRLQCVQSVSWIDAPMSAPGGSDLWGSYSNYHRAVTLLAHELGHRWLALRQARVGGNAVAIGDAAPHWLRELHAPVLFNALQPFEASLMGGSYWRDNGNGTFTDLTQPFFQGGGFSPLDLYLMGLLAKEDVPPFFLLEGASFAGWNEQGQEVWNGSPLVITVDDVIAVTGPRVPAFPATQRDFNLGLVGVVRSGQSPGDTLLTRMAGIREAFTAFWTRATGGVGRMHATAAGDFDGDLDVDGEDLELFAACVTGPAIRPPAAGCADQDLDGDHDVDHADFGLLQALMTGPGR